MIWQLDKIDAVLFAAFDEAGPIDEEAIQRFQETTRRPQHQPKREQVKRYYYLLHTLPRVSLCCEGMPLADWRGGAKIVVGTRDIIGEFAGNRALVGTKGLHLKMEPLAWLQGEPDRRFVTGAELLAAISDQSIDFTQIEQSQQQIAAKYSWKKPRK